MRFYRILKIIMEKGAANSTVKFVLHSYYITFFAFCKQIWRNFIQYRLCSNPFLRRSKKEARKCPSFAWPTRKGMLASSQIPCGMRTFSARLRSHARSNFVISKNKKTPTRSVFCSWPTRKDLNLRPSESESDALSSCATGRYK